MVTGTQLEQLDKGLSRGVHSTLTSTEVGIFIIEITPQIHPTHPLKKKKIEPLWITEFMHPLMNNQKNMNFKKNQ